MAVDALGSLVVSLIAETAQFRNELTKAAYETRKTAGEIKESVDGVIGHFEAMGRVVGVAFGAHEIFEFASHIVEAGEETAVLAQSLGTSSEAVSKLANEAYVGGRSLDDFRSILLKMSTDIGQVDGQSTKATKALQFLGVSARDPAVALEEVAKSLDRYADGAGKAAVARDLFGRGGPQFLSTLHDLAHAQDVEATFTEKSAEESKKLAEEMRLLKLDAERFAQSILETVVPALSGAIEKFRLAREAGHSIFGSMQIGTNDPAIEVERLRRQLDQYHVALENLRKEDTTDPFNSARVTQQIGNITAAIASTNAELQMYEKMQAAAINAKFAGQDFDANRRMFDKPTLHYTPADDSGAQKVSEYEQELGRLAQMAARANLDLDQLFSTEKIVAAKREFDSYVASPAWKTLTDNQQKNIRAQFEGIIATEQTTQRLQEWAQAAGEYAKQWRDAFDAYNQASEDAATKANELADSLQLELDATSKVTEAQKARAEIAKIQHDLDVGAIHDSAELQAALHRLNQEADQFDLRDKVADAMKQAAQEAQKAADETKRAFEDTAHSIEGALVSAVEGWGRKTGDVGERIKQTLTHIFETMVLRPVIAPVAGALASLFMPGAAAAGGSSALSGGNVLQTGSNLLNLFSGGATNAFESFALSGAGQFLGLSAPVSSLPGSLSLGVETAGASGLSLTGAGSALAGIAPWLAAGAIAIPLVASIFGGKRGGPKGGGFGQSGTGFDRFFTPNDQDADLMQLAKGTLTTFDSTLKALGGTGSANFAFGFDTDPNGTAASRLSVGATVNGRQVFGFRDRDEGRGTDQLQADMQIAAQRAILAALQASDLPEDIASILNSVTASTASADTVTQVLALGSAMKALDDALAANPVEDAAKAFAVSTQGAYAVFTQQGDALASLTSKFDGSVAATTALTQASDSYYASLVNLIAQIQQVRASIDDMFSNTIRSFRLAGLDDQGQYNFLRQEASTAAEQIKTAADPATVQRLETLINNDLNAAFALLTPEQKKLLSGEFIAGATNAQTLGNQRLQQIQGQASNEFDAAMKEAKDVISEAAKKLDSAAQKIDTAAGNLSDKSREPIHVDVDFTSDVPGTTEVNYFSG